MLALFGGFDVALPRFRQQVQPAEDQRLDAQSPLLHQPDLVQRFEQRQRAGGVLVDQLEAVGLLGRDATELARAQRFRLPAHQMHRRLEQFKAPAASCRQIGGVAASCWLRVAFSLSSLPTSVDHVAQTRGQWSAARLP